MGQDLERWIIEQNIERFKTKLQLEKRTEDRVKLEELLAAEQAKLREISAD